MNDGDLTLFTTILRTKRSPLKKYLLDRALRKITEQSQAWPITFQASENLKQIGALSNNLLFKASVPNLNRKLKARGLDTLYFEHWKEISVLIKEISDLDLSSNIKEATSEIKKYLEENTDCFFRLRDQEKHMQPHLQSKHWKELENEK